MKGTGGTPAGRGNGTGRGGRPENPLQWWRKSTWERERLAGRPDLHWSTWLFHPIRTFRAWLRWTPVTAAERRRHNDAVTAAAAADETTSDLDESQQAAAVCFEDRTVITAGAGSGKTRTMVARARWAVRRLGCPPERIAFITFTRAAADEIRERTPDLAGLSAGTIHHLARRVIAEVDGRTVRLSPLAEDEGLLLRRIRGWIEDACAADPALAAALEVRRAALTRRAEAAGGLARPGGRNAGRGGAGRSDGADRTAGLEYRVPPDGRKVKSYGELAAGTLLHAAGVEYRYEAAFPLAEERRRGRLPQSADLRGYAPDFYLPDDPEAPPAAHGGVWLEHYAHDADDRPPKEWRTYGAEREWKRRLHAKLGTRYVETCFGDLQREWRGGPPFAAVLAGRLRKAGVRLPPRSQWKTARLPDPEAEEERKPGTEGGAEFTARICAETAAWIRVSRQRAGPEREPAGVEAAALAAIARPVRRLYEAELARTGTTDHEGTIREAADAAARKPGRLPWEHVLIDEYQDVNPAQAAFAHALTLPSEERPDGATLAAVGDARQAIFGFQGGDPELIRTMRDPSGRKHAAAVRKPLLSSYRFGQRLADAAGLVVADELRGRVTGRGAQPPADRAAVTVVSGTLKGKKARARGATSAAAHLLDAWIGRGGGQAQDEAAKPRTVLIMARRNADVDDPDPEAGNRGAAAAGIERARLDAWAAGRGMEIEYATIHRAKGREADYALLLDAGAVRAGRSAKEQALARALEEPDTAAAEEERLWYVALTRARKAAAVLVLERAPAPAHPTLKLLKNVRAGVVEQDPEWSRQAFAPLRVAPPCPSCNADGTGSGRLVQRTGPSGTFTACSEWAGGTGPRACGYRQADCPVCEEGMLVPFRKTGAAVCRDCGSRVPLCDCVPPVPMQVRRNRRDGTRFFGCAGYPRTACGTKPYHLPEPGAAE